MSSTSASTRCVETKIRGSNGIAEIRLNRPKVNALSRSFLDQIIDAFSECEKNPHVTSILLLSAVPKIFSAGLDLNELVHTPPDQLDLVVKKVNSLTSPISCTKPVACAVTGHAIAGGFVLAAACDFVAIIDDPSVLLGLTEVRVGVPFPRSAFEVVRHSFGSNTRGFKKLVYEGKNYSALEVFQLGFGDVLSSDPVAAAVNWLEQMAALPTGVFSITKRQFSYPFWQQIQHPDPTITGRSSPEKQATDTTKVIKLGMADQLNNFGRVLSKSKL